MNDLNSLSSLLRNTEGLREQMKADLAAQRRARVKGSAGGGMVIVEANGLGDILAVHIEPALVQQNEREMIEDLLPAAINQAQDKAREFSEQLVDESDPIFRKDQKRMALDCTLAEVFLELQKHK